MGKKNQSLRELRHEIYLRWLACDRNSREVGRQIGRDNSAVAKYVRIVQAEIERGEWTPPPEAIAQAEAQSVPPVSARVATDRELRQARGEVQELREKYAHSLKEIEQLEAFHRAAEQIQRPVEPIRINPAKSTGKGEATAIVQASDWHIEERVDPATVNWLNEYNPDIATERAKRYFQNTLKLVRKERQEVQLKTLVWHLGGDMITNYLHPELEESNYMSPTEAILYVKRLILGGLKLWKEDGEFERIVVVTSYGNHGRTTHKPRISTGWKNNLEAMMYFDLAHQFADDEVIQFQVGQGEYNYFRVYDRTLRFEHGDALKYKGGIGGLTIPMVKHIHKIDEQVYADATFMGHWHQLMFFSRVHRFAVNSSLIGINAYSMHIGASPEPPTQSFHLLHSKRGFTICAPIIVTE